jgi:hypothetical protein
MGDINSSIGIIVTKHALLITQKLALYNNWKSRMHLYVGAWAKGVNLNQEKILLSKSFILVSTWGAALDEAEIERTGP